MESRSFFGGLSLTVKDVLQDHSLVSAVDVRLTVSAIGIEAYCASRKTDIWSVRFALVQDISRRPASGLGSTPALIVEYKNENVAILRDDDETSCSEDGDPAITTVLGHSHRILRGFIYHANQSFLDEIFQWILPRWSFRCATIPAASSRFTVIQARPPAPVTLRFDRPPSTVLTPPFRRLTLDQGLDYGDGESRSPPPFIAPNHTEEWAADLLELRHRETSAAALEEEIISIRNRRKERQRQLNSHFEEPDFLQAFRHPGNSVVSKEDLSVCPYCNRLAGRLHSFECDLRPVDCSWCGLRMRLTEFPYHAEHCRKSRSDDRPVRDAGRETQPPRSQPPPQPAPSAVVEAAAPADGRRCMWCKQVQPSSHDATCQERRVACSVCHQIVTVKDKKAHRSVCQLRDNPKKDVLRR
jgi:hypothetical protein